MKKFPYKRKIKNKKDISKKNTKTSIKKKVEQKYAYILKIVKLLSLILFVSFHYYFTIYTKRLIDYYYTKRIEQVRKFGRHYNESNILTFEDKINWICIHDVTKLKGRCADKILLREYSKRILKKDICNKILKIYDNPSQINISELPEQFVLKTNHGSGYNIIVHNKSELDVEKAKKTLSNWLQIDYSQEGAEFHYAFIKRKAFAEEYIGKNINTYKTFCYHGIPRYIFVYKKINGREYRTFFDMEWNRLDFHCGTRPHPTEIYPKPKTFELMKKYARKLSRPFKLARIDFYEYNGELRLSEVTFTPMNSLFICEKQEHNIELGKYLKLF